MSILEKIERRIFLRGRQGGYSQFGEDLILHFLFNNLDIEQPTYLDVGANDPRTGNNTYFFYRRGSHGVLIEPNPRLAKRLRSIRSRDTVIEAGVAFNEQRDAEFYQFPRHFDGLSTFSKEMAEHWTNTGMNRVGKIAVERAIRIPLVPLNDVIKDHFSGKAPNLLSLDVEGLDLDVLLTLDFARFAPDIICVETLKYDNSRTPYKWEDIPKLILSKGYSAYADTYANSIYCKTTLLQGKHEIR